MFKKVKITLGEASSLAGLINVAVNKVDILPFKLAHRLNRQLGKLSEVDSKLSEGQQEALKSVLGEDAYTELQESGENKKIADVMTEEQQADYIEMLEKESKSEYDAELLSESFENLIPDGEFDRDAVMALSAVVLFFEDKGVWSE